MAKLAAALKDEVTRLSRKVIRENVGPLRRMLTTNRRQIAALKAEITGLAKEVKRLQRTAPQKTTAEPESTDGRRLRFVAPAMKSHRLRIGLSRQEYAKLLGTSPQSVYNWESRKAVPRRTQIQAIAALRPLGKREARARLEGL